MHSKGQVNRTELPSGALVVPIVPQTGVMNFMILEILSHNVHNSHALALALGGTLFRILFPIPIIRHMVFLNPDTSFKV